MKAAYYNLYGTPDVLKIGELPQPVPAAGEVLVKVAAMSMNPRDNGIRSGELKWLSGKQFPKLTGADFSGTVVSTGASINNFVKGDDVYGYIQSVKGGCSAEYIAVPEKWIAKKAPGISHRQAAALPCTYLTALQALRKKAGIKPGDKVLVYGASGGVGTAALQTAKYFGAHVTAVCSTRNIDHCKAQGADEVWDYNVTDIFNQPDKFDVFFQVYSKEGLLYTKGKRLLADKGIYLTLIPSPKAMLISLTGYLSRGKRLKPLLVKTDSNDLQFLQSLVKEGKLTPFISATFDFDDIREAQRLVESNHAVGKVVVLLNSVK